MLSKCANPECAAPFHYLREGKLFQIERRNGTLSIAGPQLVGDTRSVEHFWLCGPCSETMTLAFERQQGLIVIPLKKQPAVRRAAAS
jgi:hypothetical protein